jgi:hypothetical protein
VFDQVGRGIFSAPHACGRSSRASRIPRDHLQSSRPDHRAPSPRAGRVPRPGRARCAARRSSHR